MPRLGSRKEVKKSIKVTLLINEDMWKLSDEILREYELTRPQFIRACLSRLILGCADGQLYWAKKWPETADDETKFNKFIEVCKEDRQRYLKNRRYLPVKKLMK